MATPTHLPLVQGDKGWDVQLVQQALSGYTNIIYPPLVPDGDFGPATAQAVVTYRNYFQLDPQDGTNATVDAAMWQNLGLNFAAQPVDTSWGSVTGGASGGVTAPPPVIYTPTSPQPSPSLVPAGARVRFQADMTVSGLGVHTFSVSPSDLDFIKQKLEGRGYSQINISSSGSTITAEATLAVDKNNIEGVRADLETIGNTGWYGTFGFYYLSNVRVDILSLPGGRVPTGPGGVPLANTTTPPGGNPPGSSPWWMPLAIAGIVALVAIEILSD
jgi:peptidoglycan hydrolase-like protein with peptidoglycan-binding domain